MSDFKAKCTKFNFSWGSALDPAGELTALPHTSTVSGFKGPISKGGEGKGWEWDGERGRDGGEKRQRNGRGGKEKGRKGKGRDPRG